MTLISSVFALCPFSSRSVQSSVQTFLPDQPFAEDLQLPRICCPVFRSYKPLKNHKAHLGRCVLCHATRLPESKFFSAITPVGYTVRPCTHECVRSVTPGGASILPHGRRLLAVQRPASRAASRAAAPEKLLVFSRSVYHAPPPPALEYSPLTPSPRLDCATDHG